MPPDGMQKKVQNASYDIFLPNMEPEHIKPLSATVQKTQDTEKHIKQYPIDIVMRCGMWKTLKNK